MSQVKTLTRQDLARNARRRGASSKASRLSRKAVKILEPGDLVRYNGTYNGFGHEVEEGSYGMIVALVEDDGWLDGFHVLCGKGILKIERKCLDRIQEFWTNERKLRLGDDTSAKDL